MIICKRCGCPVTIHPADNHGDDIEIGNDYALCENCGVLPLYDLGIEIE